MLTCGGNLKVNTGIVVLAVVIAVAAQFTVAETEDLTIKPYFNLSL